MVLDDGELAGGWGSVPTPVEISPPATSRGPSSFVPFGIDAQAETVFAWDLGTERADGELGVVVLTNDLALTVDDFPSFLELCLDMLCAEIQEKRALTGHEARAMRSPGVERSRRAA